MIIIIINNINQYFVNALYGRIALPGIPESDLPGQTRAVTMAARDRHIEEKLNTFRLLSKLSTCMFFAFAALLCTAAVANDQLTWDQPATLRGTFETGMFDNCCFNGEEKHMKYYAIRLAQRADVKGKANSGDDAAPDVDVIQLGIAAKDIPSGLARGRYIEVQCSGIWEGFTGHYALHVYCNEAKIAPPARLPVPPSFDCAKASGLVENMICADPGLAKMDAELAVVYRDAKAHAADPAVFKQQTAEEWKWRQANCHTIECIASWYGRRKEQLLAQGGGAR